MSAKRHGMASGHGRPQGGRTGGAAMKARRVLLPALLLLTACAHKEAPAPSAQAEAPAPQEPWSWHALGSLIVVEGELATETDLVLEGRSIRHERHAELGPLRWELMRPPKGELAELRDADKKVLARFRFEGDGALALGAEPPPPPAALPSPRAPKIAVRTPLPPPPKPALRRNAPRAEDARPAPAMTKAAPMPAAPRLNPVSAPPPALPPARLDAAFPGAGEALNLTQGPRRAKRLLLSFDGGSNAEGTGEILDALKARGIRTTLFLTGTFIQKFPGLVTRMAAEGHELGNHTMHHPHMAPNMRADAKWTKAKVQEELLSADRALVKLLGRPMAPLWRAPYGEHTAEIRRWAEELGYRHVGWSEGADSLDWATPRERRLYRPGDAVLTRLHGRLARNGEGLIVLMHLGSEREEGDRPADKLGAFLDKALAEGWTFVSATEMLRDMGKPAWNPEGRLALLQHSISGSGAE
jgi:peptidoglycan/xylan/chitin deacetylase (PgdA/CDA1 family)